MNQRLMIYRRMADGAQRRGDCAASSTKCATATARRPPPCSTWPTSAASACSPTSLGIETIDRDGPLVVFKFRDRTKVDPMRIIALVQERGDLQLIPPSTGEAGHASRKGPGARRRRPSPLQALAEAEGRAKLGVKPPSPSAQPAWWTARATAGEVTPGFTKAEILKTAPEDPRAPGRSPKLR